MTAINMTQQFIYKAMTLILSLMSYFSGLAQTDYPVTGKPIPEFTLTDVHYYSKNSFTPADANGKWLVLDFWSQGCTACVQSFPKVNKLQLEFKDDIQFLLVGKNDKYNRNIEKVFERFKKNMNLNLSIAYDSTLFLRFGIIAVPHVIIVDPKSNVYAVTFSSALTHENLQALIDNKKPELPKNYDAPGIEAKSRWSYLLNENDPHDEFLYRSVLSANKGEGQEWFGGIDRYAAWGFYQVTRIDLGRLYMIAWFGDNSWSQWDNLYQTHWMSPMIEVSDPLPFQANYSTTDNTGFYNYSLVIPRIESTKARLMELMQSDLNKCFGYQVSVETRVMPYWKLTATDDARQKLKSKYTQEALTLSPTGITGKSFRINIVISQIENYVGHSIPYLDETGITEPIDLSFSAVMTDIKEVQRGLKKHGLILEKSQKEFQVLVIRDPATPERYSLKDSKK